MSNIALFPHCSYCQQLQENFIDLESLTSLNSSPAALLTRHSAHKKQKNSKHKANGFRLSTQKTENKRQWEIPRKTMHSSIGFIVIYLYSIDANPITIRNYLLVAFAVVTSADIIRFTNQRINHLYIKYCGFLMRDIEKHERVNGVVYYLAGCIGALTIFPKDIAALSIIILSWCDTAASFIGRLYGHHTYKFKNGKSLAGTLGAITVGTISALLFWGTNILKHDNQSSLSSPSWQPETSPISLPILAILTGLISGASELIDIWGLDDNLVMPLAAGSMLWIILQGLGFGGGDGGGGSVGVGLGGGIGAFLSLMNIA
ncbi:hypothetical protein G9A89_023391 [Geosiphon pyriformis]|nr:hypothetical protein G9A89_023391 [Geosiphon pyriformis]